MFTQTNADAEMQTATSEERPGKEIHTDASGDFPKTPALADIAGLSPFSSGWSESECSALPGVEMVRDEAPADPETRSSAPEDESYSPPPPRIRLRRKNGRSKPRTKNPNRSSIRTSSTGPADIPLIRRMGIELAHCVRHPTCTLMF